LVVDVDILLTLPVPMNASVEIDIVTKSAVIVSYWQFLQVGFSANVVGLHKSAISGAEKLSSYKGSVTFSIWIVYVVNAVNSISESIVIMFLEDTQLEFELVIVFAVEQVDPSATVNTCGNVMDILVSAS